MFTFDKSRYDEAFVARGEKLYDKKKVHYTGKNSNGQSSFYVYGTNIYSVLVSADYTRFSCNCPWRNMNDYCKHEIAVQLYLDDFLNGREAKDGGIAPVERTFYTADECKEKIQKINRRHKRSGYIDYEHGFAWGNELATLLYECKYIAESGVDLELALKASALVLENVIKNWDKIDDDGTLVSLLHECFDILIKYKERVGEDLKKEINKSVEKATNSDVADFAEDYLKELN